VPLQKEQEEEMSSWRFSLFGRRND
jgi:hypothetical protein